MNTPRFLFALAVLTAAGPSQTLTAGIVTTTADSGAGSLRAAISSAVNGEVITFALGLNGSTITLSGGSLTISGVTLTIDATSLSSGISISGNNNSRVFTIISNSNVTLRSLTLTQGNEVTGSGGALYLQGGNLVMTDCSVISSYAAGSGGGAVIVDAIQAIFDRCSFIGNHGNDYGGGIFFIGSSSSATVSNSIISGNRSLNGGGILNFDMSPRIVNCTIQGNSGSGIRNEYASVPILRNTIVWGNRTGIGDVYSQQIFNNGSSASADTNFCLIEGGPATLNNLNGSTTNNPIFIRPASPSSSSSPPTTNVDLRLFTGSPVLNVGDNASNATSLDRAGKTRIQNTTIDLGAFEGAYVTFAFLHPSLAPTADANGNGISNFLEYATGIDPSAPDDSSVRPRLSTSGGFRFLTSSQRSNAADTTAFWQTSTTLASNSWQKMVLGINYTIDSTSNPTPSRQQTVLKLLDVDSRRFYRQGFSDNN